ncbi:MAG: hypothetical protein JW821_05420, partial [Deltaproteobacteria bacterium]|nr:hypothetical protein [Deltaproteobacteria bacterium]
MKLGRLLEGVRIETLVGDPDMEIESLTYDSRLALPGALFVALRGHERDGHDYLEDAVRRGASGLVAEDLRGIEGFGARVRVVDSREALSRLA